MKTLEPDDPILGVLGARFLRPGSQQLNEQARADKHCYLHSCFIRSGLDVISVGVGLTHKIFQHKGDRRSIETPHKGGFSRSWSLVWP